jgi:hypothetical protein
MRLSRCPVIEKAAGSGFFYVSLPLSIVPPTFASVSSEDRARVCKSVGFLLSFNPILRKLNQRPSVLGPDGTGQLLCVENGSFSLSKED